MMQSFKKKILDKILEKLKTEMNVMIKAAAEAREEPRQGSAGQAAVRIAGGVRCLVWGILLGQGLRRARGHAGAAQGAWRS